MGLNEVFKKVSAINEVTELESHKIELGLIEEYNSSKLNATTLTNEVLQKDYPRLVNEINALKDKIRKSINLVTDLSNKNSSLDMKFKELGLDWRKDSNYKGFNELVKNEKTLMDILNKFK